MKPVFFLLAWTAVLAAAACAYHTERVLMIPTPDPERWQPQSGLSWQWQINGANPEPRVEAEVYDIDLYVDPAVVAALRARGTRVIAYISVGSWEDWRPDAARFPEEVLGKEYEGWPGERWLDIRRLDLLAPILRARLDTAAAAGFDAVEPDNMEIYTNDTGFPLTYEDQLAFARWLAEEAHARGLAIGQKNAPDQVRDLVNVYDFAITEDCFVQGWCEAMLPYLEAGKPVFAAEYTDTGVDFAAACAWGKQRGFSLILKKRELDAWVQTCP